jgi:hypothetical protein
MSLKYKELPIQRRAGGERTRGEKIKVTSIMLLKTHGEKMTEIGFSIMLLKSKEL